MKTLDRYLMTMVLVPTIGGTVLAVLVYSAFALATLLRDPALASAPISTMENCASRSGWRIASMGS